MHCDVIVAGGGPAGLAFALGLSGAGLDVVLVERQPLAALADPSDDGREIALTHRSVAMLRALTAWSHIAPGDVAPLRAAQVRNGASPFALAFDPDGTSEDRLGQFVSNHHIRRALFAATAGQPRLTVLHGTGIVGVATDAGAAAVTLTDGRLLRARLLVAADSRFSDVRARLGIAARTHRLGKSMLVARVTHDRDHRGIATEWFGHGHTLALLPLSGGMSSVVLTMPEDAIARIAARDAASLAGVLTRHSRGMLGPMQMAGPAHVYPLATVWSHHFAATRAALIGDAAVGMHPVTAHGFNLGLRSAVDLATRVARAAARGGDIGDTALLRAYEASHRLAAAPLFAATAMIVGLYTDDRAPARAARPMLLRAAARLSPARAGVTRMLMR
jgi:ubiquinone biosynthesis UbiH/UbiF/VisC/COQ6 family hydroxylase